jgi:hypothetical protein
MGQHRLHSSPTPVGPAAILLQSRPPERRCEEAVAAVHPRALGEQAALDVSADEEKGGAQVGAVGCDLGHVHIGVQLHVGWTDLQFALAVLDRHSVPSSGTGVGATDKPCCQVVELVEVRRFEDDERELDEDVVSELGAEATVHSRGEPPGECFEEDGARVGVSVGEGGEGPDDLVCVCLPVAVSEGPDERRWVRVSGELWVLADPAGGEGSVGEAPVAGADLLLQGGHGVLSVGGVVSLTVRICGPGFGPDLRIRPCLWPPGGPGFGPGSGPDPCSGLVSVGVGR